MAGNAAQGSQEKTARGPTLLRGAAGLNNVAIDFRGAYLDLGINPNGKRAWWRKARAMTGGKKMLKTLQKEQGREFVRQMVTAGLGPLVRAQIDNTFGARTILPFGETVEFGKR